MKNKKKKSSLFLNAPKWVRVRRHNVGDDVRFTIADKGFRKLVALARNDKFVWIKNGFSA